MAEQFGNMKITPRYGWWDIELDDTQPEPGTAAIAMMHRADTMRGGLVPRMGEFLDGGTFRANNNEYAWEMVVWWIPVSCSAPITTGIWMSGGDPCRELSNG